MSQDELWKEEGNAWYQRNHSALSYDRTQYFDPLLVMLGLYEVRPTLCILDVGCSDGWRVAWLSNYYGCRGIGVDVSAEAIAEGRRLYPHVELHEASATALPVPSESCDLAVVSFLLHCLSRETLLLATSEIDRVLMPGGLLALSDFSPDTPSRRPWHHREGIWTYKLPRAGAGIFEATGMYRQVACLTFDHDGHRLSADAPGERHGACLLLRKESQYQCV